MAIDQPSSTDFRADQFTLADIRAALPHLRPADLVAALAATAYGGALGQAATHMGELRTWLAGWQGRGEPRIERPRIVLFAGIHGTDDDARAWAQAYARGRIEALTSGTSPTIPLAERADADLRLYEIATDLAPRPANEAAVARAIVYGMTVVEPGIDVLGVATLSPGLHWRETGGEPFDALCRQSGEEIAAAIGALIAARMAQTPVVVDGMGARLAADLLARAQKGAADHIRAARRSTDFDRAAVLDGRAAGDSDGADAAEAIVALRALLEPIGRN